MRSCLRDGKPAHIFALDRRTITGLSMFFDKMVLQEVFPDYTFVQGTPGARQTTSLGRALTASERNYIKRLRKHSEYADFSNEELIAMRNNKINK
jgi:hypothetical protein